MDSAQPPIGKIISVVVAFVLAFILGTTVGYVHDLHGRVITLETEVKSQKEVQRSRLERLGNDFNKRLEKLEK